MIVEGPLVRGFPSRVQGTHGQSLAMASMSPSAKVASETPSVVAPKRVVITLKIVKARMKMLKKVPEILSLNPSAKCMLSSPRPQQTLHMSQTWLASSGRQNIILYEQKA